MADAIPVDWGGAYLGAPSVHWWFAGRVVDAARSL